MTFSRTAPAQPKLTNLFQAVVLNGASVALTYSVLAPIAGGGVWTFGLASFLGAALTLGGLSLAVLWQDRRVARRDAAMARRPDVRMRRAVMIAAWDEDRMDEAMDADIARAAKAMRPAASAV